MWSVERHEEGAGCQQLCGWHTNPEEKASANTRSHGHHSLSISLPNAEEREGFLMTFSFEQMENHVSKGGI